MVERTYDATIAKPTAKASGTNKARTAPCMKSAGRNTAKMHIMASRQGTAVSTVPCQTACATDDAAGMRAWMFSTTTTASSTKMPTASANPPSVMMLTVCRASHSATSDAIRASGMVITTTVTLRQSRKNSSTIRPVSKAPSNPSLATSPMALVTYGDWSNSKRTRMSSDIAACIRDRLLLTRLTTSSVEASGRLVMGRNTERRPLTKA